MYVCNIGGVHDDGRRIELYKNRMKQTVIGMQWYYSSRRCSCISSGIIIYCCTRDRYETISSIELITLIENLITLNAYI